MQRALPSVTSGIIFTSATSAVARGALPRAIARDVITSPTLAQTLENLKKKQSLKRAASFRIEDTLNGYTMGAETAVDTKGELVVWIISPSHSLIIRVTEVERSG